MAKEKNGFTMENWTSHKSTSHHAQQLGLREEARRLDARVKANDPKLSKKAKMAHKMNARNQVRLEIRLMLLVFLLTLILLLHASRWG